MNQLDIDKLKMVFLQKIGGAVTGDIVPGLVYNNATKAYDQALVNLGTEAQPFNHIYATNITVDVLTVTGSSNAGGGTTGIADTARGLLEIIEGSSVTENVWYVSSQYLPSTIPVLTRSGTLPEYIYPQALLLDGSRAMNGILRASGGVAVSEGSVVDGVDVSLHDHDPNTNHMGTQILHSYLGGLGANDHPQYPQKNSFDTITGEWTFTGLEDQSIGWRIKASEGLLQTFPFNLTLKSVAAGAQLLLGDNNEITANVSGADISLTVGLGANKISLSATDPTYLLWTGLTPATAPFSVARDGGIHAGAGDIGGWQISPDKMVGSHMSLFSMGEIHLGDGSVLDNREDLTVFSAVNSNGWRIWSGNSDPTLANFRVNKWGQVYMDDAFISGVLRSENYQSGSAGFSIDSAGRAEFNHITARGRIDAVIASERTVSAMSGTLLIGEAAVLAADMAADADSVLVDADIFDKDDILWIRPDRFRQEWMRVASSPIPEGTGFRYYVVRNLDKADTTSAYKPGETFVRVGTAVMDLPTYPLASGEAGSEYGMQMPGGSGSKVGGGWLVLEGNRNTGPYFGVARRRGPVYDQFDEVVRIGNLQGILDYTEQTYGAFVGDVGQYWSYDTINGLRIKTRGGSIAIDNNGVTTDQLWLTKITDQDLADLPNDMASKSNIASLFLYKPEGATKPYLGVQMRIDEAQVTIIDRIGDMSKDVWDADNDGKVDYANSAETVPWSGVANPPATYAPSPHTHPGTDIIGLDMTEAMQRSWFGV